MSHEHSHENEHHHDHHHHASPSDSSSASLDLSVPDEELSPADVGRRRFLRNAGLLGAASAMLAGGGIAAAGPAWARDVQGGGDRLPDGGLRWLAGDHHTHTQYSGDALYRVIDHVQHANAYGLDWMVVTDHGSVQHAKIGVEKVNPDIRAARAAVPETLVFQGLEWNIPSAEHGTVFVHPGPDEVAVLKQFENAFDGSVNNTGASSPANEAIAIAGVNFLADAVARRRVPDALFLANHPSRKGLDSPHEIRGWRDAAPDIAIGFEGAPGHQAGGMPAPAGPGRGRGEYDNSPTANSFPGYPLESYRTWGGFDWMTATVGGLWDSLLAEGKPWWITANSDSHKTFNDLVTNGPNSDFTNNGFFDPPVYTGKPNSQYDDFWPGYFSRTHVGAADFSYQAVMSGLRAGRVWVDHGRLIDGIDVRVRADGDEVTIGETLGARRGRSIGLTIDIDLATRPNWAQFIPKLARVDVIRGAVTGAVTDPDVFTTPQTSVVTSFDVSSALGHVTLTYDLGRLDEPFYVRLRGTDGMRSAPGFLGSAVDPMGPAMDVIGDADPWMDLWFYTNPIWVVPSR